MVLTAEPQIHVTEWTFNCLAYLFKYLSRLLTTDLVPTYDLISVLLGKTHQKHFVSRFTAESLSFLVRKCTGDSLSRIVSHIIEDIYTIHNEQFFSSCTLLFAESMKSTSNSLHSRSGNILDTIFESVKTVPIEHTSYIADLVTDIYIALLQHSQATTAVVLYEKATKFINNTLSDDKSFLELILPAKLVFALSGLRKGARVTDWNTLYAHLFNIFRAIESITAMEIDGEDDNLRQLSYPLLQASCVLFQCSDLKSVTSNHSKLLSTFSTIFNGNLFLPLLQLLLEQSLDRFKDFAIPYIVKFVGSNENKKYKSEIAFFILQLENKGLMNNSLEPVPGKLRLTMSNGYVLNAIEHTKSFALRAGDISSKELQELWWNLEVLRASISVDKKVLFNELLQIFDLLTQSSVQSSLKASIVGKVLGIFSNMQMIKNDLELQVLPRVLAIISTVHTSVDMLKGFCDILATLIREKSQAINLTQAQTVVDILSTNLTLPSKDLRKFSLDIIAQLYIVRCQTVPKLITQCQQIEDLPLDLNNARTLQMHIRNVGINFTVTGTEFTVDRVIPRYMFGLLTVQFQPVWESAIDALAKIAERDSQTVWAVAFSWISPGNSEIQSQTLIDEIESVFPPEQISPRDLNCTNLRYVTEHTYACIFQYFNASYTMSQYVQKRTSTTPVPDFLRTQAIKVLIKIPTVAERFSRNLVPFILWDENEDDEEEEETPAGASWTFKERTHLLELFAHFTNPKSIYRGEELYERYMYLLGHRLLHVQQVALKCIFTFKNPTVRKYKENLNGLLDDPRFKEELLLLLRKSGEDEETIHEDDREILLPIVIRILFGRAQVAKAGNTRQGRRFAVLNALMNVEPEYVRLFVSLAADKLHAKGFFTAFDENSSDPIDLDPRLATQEPKENFLRRELGFVTMIEDMLNLLRGKIHHCLDIIMESLMFALHNSQKATSFEPNSVAMKTVRSIRNTGIKCLELLFRVMENVTSWSPYFATIYKHLIQPRLVTFAADNLEQPSAMMKLFETLSSKPSLVQYLGYDESAIIKGYFSCIADERVKDPVVGSVTDTMTNIMNWSGDDKLVNRQAWEQIVDISVPIILAQLPHLFTRSSTIQLLDKESTLLVTLASGGYVINDSVRKQLVSVCISAIDRPSQQISLKIKGDILRCLSAMLASDLAQSEEIISAYSSLARMFKQISDRYARQSLCELYAVFGQKLERYARIGPLIHSLNAYSTKRLGLPDFDRRLDTFATINENLYSDLNAEEWRPLLFNLLFFLKDPEELSIRSNAEYALRRFVDCIAGQATQEDADSLIALLDEIVLPALKIGLRDRNETFRAQYITILGHMVKNINWYEHFADMKSLLFGGDEEASFFNNILHIQIHRRQRAVRRLGILSEQLQLRDTNIAHYLMPIIEHFVEDTDGTRSGLANDTVNAIGSLTRHLTFNQYRAITKRYIGNLSNPDTIKVTVKLVDAIAESLGDPSASTKIKSLDEDVDVEMTDGKQEKPKAVVKTPFPGAVRLADNLPSQNKLNNFIINDVVPSLRKVLDKRDENTFTLRIPLAIPVIKFLKVLPHDLLIVKIPGVLTGLCQVLRAKSQELRDSLRKTLCTVTSILGPKYLYFILKELRGALRRGAQLHILGYTVHALLVHIGPVLQPGDLDDSLQIISEIIMEDTFGTTGAEKDNEGYTTQMKEVKQHKSYDTGEIVAANITLGKFGILINPIKSVLLYEKLSLKIERKVEELLRRLALGLHANRDAASRDVLVMCYELYKVSQNIQDEEDAARKAAEEREDDDIMEDNESHFIVSLDAKSHSYSSKKRGPKLHTQNLHILVKFVFETVRQVLNKHMELLSVENVAGYVPFLGDGISSNFEDVQMSSLRLLTLILRLPIEDVDDKLMEYLRKALEIIQGSPTTNTEICHAALRFVSVVIRLKENVEIPETALGYILERLKPDLEEPDRQGIAFTFIKAILARGVVIPEVYDIMDKISNVMVTSQTKVSREACRGVYYQFLTEYPQGKERLKNQFKFLVGNLQYPTVDGRLSVMELIHQLLIRIDDAHLEDITTSFFVALVLVLISDDSQQCKESASLLIRKLLSRAGETQLEFINSYTLGWLKKSPASPAESQLLRGGLQVAGLYFAELGTAKNKLLLQLSENCITEILSYALPDSEVEVEWSVVYFAMQLFSKLAEMAPTRVFSAGSGYKERWNLVERNLLYPHAWVRLAASRLMGLLFAHVKTSKEPVEVAIQAKDLQMSAFKFVRQLSAANVTEELAFQDVKNLVFIGMQFETENVMYVKPDASKEDKDADEGQGGDEPDEEKALNWLVRKISSILRTEKRARELQHSKKASIQFLASVIQFVSTVERLQELEDEITFAFYNFLEPAAEEEETETTKEFKALAQESMDMLQKRVGTTEYLKVYSRVRQMIADRRAERKKKRAVQAVTAPDIHARKKIRKNEKKREKRKHVKDENGYYHTKKKRV